MLELMVEIPFVLYMGTSLVAYIMGVYLGALISNCKKKDNKERD